MNYKKSIVTIDEAQRLIETSSPFYVYDEAAIAQNAPNVFELLLSRSLIMISLLMFTT